MNLNGLPDDAPAASLDLSGLPDTNAQTLREQYRSNRVSPDESARSFEISRRTGLPKPVVDRNRAEAERRATEPDWNNLELAAPVTVREMAANTKLFELANDDTENMREIERTMSRRSAGTIGGVPFDRSRGEIKPIRGPEPSFSSIAYGLYNSLVQGGQRYREGARMQFADALGFDEMFNDALRKRNQSQLAQDVTTPDFTSATARGLYSGGESFLQNLPGLAASIVTRNPAPALASAGIQTELDAYGKYRARGASGGQALVGALGEGAVEVATEMIPLRTMLGAFGQPGKTAAKEFLKSQVQEQFGEQAATILQDAIDTAVANPDKTWGQYLAERPDAAYQTFLATLVQSAVMGAGHAAVGKLAGQEARAVGAARDAEALAQLSQLAAASKLRARDPQTFQDFVAATNENGPVQDVYIDARTLQQAGVDTQLLAQVSPTAAAQLEEAVSTGGDLVIPVAEYAARIAGTDLDQVLTPHLRTAEDALSLDEAQRFYQGQAEEFQKAAAKAMEEKQADDAWQQSAKAVETALFDQLKNAGRFTDDVNTAYATLMRDFYVATAARLGITPQEMFDRYPIQVAAERAAGAARMEQPTPEGAREATPPLSQIPSPIAKLFQSVTDALGITQPAQVEAQPAAAQPRGEPLDMGQFFNQPVQTEKYEGDTIEVDGVLRSTTNSNGKPIAQTEEGLRNFWRWFGDSKVVGTEGRPLVVYHGSPDVRGIFAEGFKAKHRGSVFFAAADYKVADSYADDRRAWDYQNAEPQTIPLYISIKNPMIVDAKGAHWKETERHVDDAKDAGHDGIIIKNSVDFYNNPKGGGKTTTVYAWFSPTQAKSAVNDQLLSRVDRQPILGATGNSGAFDPTNPSILAQPAQTENRGEISFGADITQSPSVITLFKNADLSTFLHEMGHFQLEVLANIANQPNAPQEIVDDLNKVFAWFGIKGDEAVVGGGQAGVLGQGARSPFDVQGDLFAKDFATKRTTIKREVVVSSKGSTETIKRGNVDSTGKQITNTVQGLERFWDWYGDGPVDEKGRPILMYHSTNGDIAVFETGRETTNNYGILGDVTTSRAGIFATPALDFSEEYLRPGDGQNVMPIYMALQNPLDLRRGLTEQDEMALENAGIRTGFIHNVQNGWELFDNDDDGNNAFVDALKSLGYDGAIITEDSPGGGSEGGETYIAFESATIKSAIGNRGTFDPNNPNILRQGDDTQAPNASNLPQGRTPLEVWRAMSLEEKRPYHEQFARGFEAYLFEGKAPSQELTGLFQRFRAWLVNVYKSIRSLNVEINDEIRGVFDRLVATDEAIRQAEEARAYTPLFTTAEEMGDEQAFADYQREAALATQEAKDELQTRSLRDMRWLDNARARILKQMQADAKAKRKAVQEEVTAEVNAAPVWQAKAWLKENKDGTQDEAAQLFGFTSADHLKSAIKEAGSKADLIAGMTDQRVLERYGDLSDPDTLARAVDEAIHNEARARFVATELKAISKAVGPVRAMTKAAKEAAEAMIARKKLRDIKPSQHASAETRAAKAAEKAMRAGDTAQAAVEKRNQLIQGYATRTAYDALTEIDKAVSYVNKFDNEGTRKNLDADYLDQIDTLRERFDFRKSVTNKEAAKRASLLEWVESQRAQGFEPDIPPEVLSEAARKPYRELTLEELRGLVDTVKQIEHLGRLKHKLLTAADQREYEAARDEIVASIVANAKKSLPEERASDRGFLVAAGRMFKGFMAAHRKFSSLARGFDGFKDGGPAWEYLVRNMNARGDFEAVETEKATRALSKLLVPVTDKANGKLTEKQFFPEIGKSFSREERISMLLNMGNEANLERLLTGERIAPAQLQQIVGTLTQADAEFANKVWEYLDSYWPQVAEKERRVTGKVPEKVEASPFTLTLNDGTQVTMRGGYYPIAYDPLRSERSSADINAEVARQVQQGFYARAQTRRGHTKARTDSTGRPLRYDFGEVIANHVTQVIHDLAWHEYLIDANRLLRSTAIENAVREHYGVEALKEMKDTLTDIAVGNMGTEKGAALWNHLRYGATIAGLGFNVFNTLQNLTGVTQSMSRIGVKWVIKGAAHWAGDARHLESSVAKVHEKSDFMRLRSKTMQREINDIRNKVSGRDSRLEAAYFYLQAKTQLIVDIPTWWGAYEKAMAENDMTEAKAIALADQAVIDAQGSGQTKDLAGIQRGGAGMKLFTAFYSFFNTTFNLTAEAYQKTDFKKPADVALFAADVALLYSVPALLSTLLKAALQGDWDDEEKLAKKLIGDQISFAMGTVVGLREAAAAIKAALGVDEGFGYTGPASVRFFSDLYTLGKQVQQGEADGAFWKALDNVGGTLFHYPAGQINRTVSGINALYEGRTSNPMAIFMGAPKP